MNTFYRVFSWGAVLAVAVWSAAYFVLHFESSAFVESTMGNLFATVLGLIVGVPLALEINRRQQAEQSKQELANHSLNEDRRRRKVLSLLRSELCENKSETEQKREFIDSGGKRIVESGPLRDEMWAAFSDGGELQHVNDPDLLASIASAYHEIRSNIYLERQFITSIHFPGMRMHQEKYPQDYILEYLTETDGNLLKAIDKAVDAIDKALF